MAEVSDRDLLMKIDGIGGAVADRLLDRYGSAEAVLDAHRAGLKGVSGVGSAVAKNINNTTIDSLRPAESQHADKDTVDSNAVRRLTAIDGIGDTVAERLLARFGSISAIVNATPEALNSVSGVGKSTASMLNEVPEDGANAQANSGREAMHVSGEPSSNGDHSGAPTVQNMVLSGDLDQDLLLRAISIDMRKSTIEEGPHGGERLVYDAPRTEGTVHLTAKGKILILGVSSRTEADELAETFFKNLPSGVPIDDSTLDLEVNNIVLTATVDNPVPLEGLAQELHGDEAEYEPGGFPGFSFTLPNISCTCVLFGNGKVNIIGANSVEEAKSALDRLNETLSEMNPDNLHLPPDEAHKRLDEITSVIEVDPDTLAEAHNNIEVYSNEIWQSSRGNDGIAAMALYLASEDYTQSEIAETANVSEVTIRNAAKEFRDGTDITTN